MVKGRGRFGRPTTQAMSKAAPKAAPKAASKTASKAVSKASKAAYIADIVAKAVAHVMAQNGVYTKGKYTKRKYTKRGTQDLALKKNAAKNPKMSSTFIVENLLARQEHGSSGIQYYIVKWKGGLAKHGNSGITLEPEENLKMSYTHNELMTVPNSTDGYLFSTSPEMKKMCNTLFAKHASEVYTLLSGTEKSFASTSSGKGRGGAVVVLDTPLLYTVATLLQHRVPACDIHVANPFCYETLCEAVESEPRATTPNLHKKTIGEFFATTKEKFAGVWLDYCCTFEGAQGMSSSPRKDIDIFFRRGLAQPRCAFAVTLCARTKSSESGDAQRCIAHRHIVETALRHGFIAHFKRDRVYGAMYFLQFELAQN